MSISINNHIRHFDFIEKQLGQRKSSPKDTATGETNNNGFDRSGNQKDIVEIRNLGQEAVPRRLMPKTDDQNTDEAKQLLNFAVKLLSSENDKSRLEKIYGFRQEKIVKLLSV